MESKILETVHFDLSFISCFRYLQRLKIVSQEKNTTVYNLALYLCELCLIDFKMIKYIPSLVASSCWFLAMKILKKENWPEVLKNDMKYNEN